MTRLAAIFLTVASGLAFCASATAGDPPSLRAIYSKDQAARGQVLYESTCGLCHTASLRGRIGVPEEMPPLSSLPVAYVQTIDEKDGLVPPLVGAAWASHWGDKSARAYIARVAQAIQGFPPKGADERTAIDLVAYFLQSMGAKAGEQPLTANTDVTINDAIAPQVDRIVGPH